MNKLTTLIKCLPEAPYKEQMCAEIDKLRQPPVVDVEPVGVFADVNSLIPEQGSRWEHMVDSAYDPANGYIYLYPAPPDTESLRQRVKELEEESIYWWRLRKENDEQKVKLAAQAEQIKVVRDAITYALRKDYNCNGITAAKMLEEALAKLEVK